MILTYRYKLLPSRAQYAALAALLEAQRLLYNAALQERIEAWRKAGKSITKLDHYKSLTAIRAADVGYSDMPVAMSRWAIAKVDEAMAGFFGRVRRGGTPGFPRYRNIARWRSFGFDEFHGIRLRDGKLLFKPLVGGLRVHMHRPIPEGASIKSCTFTRQGRHWFVNLAVDVPATEAHPAPNSAVGIDVGIEHLATTSDGRHYANVRPRARREERLRRAQRALARCRHGSKRRRKVKARLAAEQRRIVQARNTHLHQVSADIARRYALVAVEDLRLRNMTRSAKGTVKEPGTNVAQKAGLNRALLDAAPGLLISMIAYKAGKAGGRLVKVDSRGTSQECSSCSETVRKELAERRHVCGCGANLHRDVNAARNVLDRGLAALGRAMPPGGGGGSTRCRIGKAVADAA